MFSGVLIPVANACQSTNAEFSDVISRKITRNSAIFTGNSSDSAGKREIPAESVKFPRNLSNSRGIYQIPAESDEFPRNFTNSSAKFQKLIHFIHKPVKRI